MKYICGIQRNGRKPCGHRFDTFEKLLDHLRLIHGAVVCKGCKYNKTKDL
jgi:hypothetical protein